MLQFTLHSPDFNAANCSGLILIILGVLLPEVVCWFCVEFVLMTMPPDLTWEEAEDAPKRVEALTTRVTVGVVTLVAGAAFTPLLSRTIVGFCNLRFKTFYDYVQLPRVGFIKTEGSH